MEQNENYIPITLWIAERGYRIKIKKEDEEAVRLAVKLADNKINELRRNFAGKDDQDFLAMALISYAADQVTEPDRLHPTAEFKLKEMIDNIERVLE